MMSYFARIVDFIGWHPHYALAAIFLLALSEAIPLIGTIVPGSTLIIGICAIATGAHVNPWPLLGAAILGAIFGDGLSFWLGCRYHREVLLHWPLNRYPQFVDRSEVFIKTYGGASVFLARFIAVVRAFVPLVAGILGMSSLQFYAVNILSAVVWAPAHVFSGVLLGMALRLAGLNAGLLAILLIVGLITLSAAGQVLRFYLKRQPPHGHTRLNSAFLRHRISGFCPVDSRQTCLPRKGENHANLITRSDQAAAADVATSPH
jgi:membrane protein DedA with SNARE-associated domain